MECNGSNLCGWELKNFDQEVFETHVLEVFGGCKSCEKVDECTTPCESVRRLVPREGKIVELGREQKRGAPKKTYFALLKQGEARFIVLSEPEHYWASAGYIAQEQVPAWVLSELDSNNAQAC